MIQTKEMMFIAIKLTGFNTQISDNLNDIAYMRFSSPQIDSASVVVVDETII